MCIHWSLNEIACRLLCWGAKDTEMQGPGADRPGFEAGARRDASILGRYLGIWLLLGRRYEGDLDLRPSWHSNNQVLGHPKLLDL